MSRDLSRETVFITGASRGLGRALADAFGGAGARLVLCARGAADLEDVASALRARGVELEWGTVDVSDPGDVAALVARAVERFGPITVLVNNASILGPRVRLAEHPVDAWRQVLEVNLTGVLIPTQAVLPGMREARNAPLRPFVSTLRRHARPSRSTIPAPRRPVHCPACSRRS
ncbi:MAG: SDR family NAD(P)-dependent oxidoreductase [Gemmatimonadota bacterium]